MATKSVILCDMEGVIESINDPAEKIFGYDKEELIGKKRVSIFSPGEIVLQNVGMWLKEAREKGEYITKTQFVKKNGESFSAKIRITPTYANGKDAGQTGYCGVTEVIEEDVDVPIKWTTKMIKGLAIMRMPFLSAVLVPAFVAGAFAYHYLGAGADFPWLNFSLTCLGVALLHLASNVLNDYFDVKDGTDDANNAYFTQYTGGSRAIELGLIDLKGTKRLGYGLLAAATLVGLYLTWQSNINTLYIGLAGAFLGYFYTAPPFRLVARRGLGELAIALAFGSLVTLGTVNVLTETLHWMAFIIGIPMGLLTANILLINEFPDAASDATTGKNHLVVTFGKKASIGIYAAILFLAVASYVWIFFLLGAANYLILITALYTLVFGISIIGHVRKNYKKRELVKSNVNTIILSATSGLVFLLAVILG
jgi:1,4-dihydroxy-2-naphthoate octaprenyltransferase